MQNEFVAFASIIDDVFTGDGTAEIRELFGEEVFEFSKPSTLLKKLIMQGGDPDAIVLDFFAGSGTTAHAVLTLNKEDGGNRRFILVQIPEPTGRSDFPTIANITEERIRRVIKKLNDEDATELQLNGANTQDRGFQVFKLAESNFKTWDANKSGSAEELVRQLEMHVDHLREGRTAPDFLYEILLKSGFPLTSPVEQVTLGGQSVCSIAGGALLISLERKLTLDAIRAMSDKRPERVVCLDEGFAGNDQLKTNAVQTFRSKSIVFRTV